MRHLTVLAVALVTFTASTTSAQAGGGQGRPTNADPRAGMPATAARDTITEPILLSAEQVKSYLAVAHALVEYWNANAALFAQAPITPERCYKIPSATRTGCGMGMSYTVGIDYPAVVTRDPAVAAIFTANHVAPKQWVNTRIAISQAENWLDGLEQDPSLTAPKSTSVLGKNLTVVQALREDIDKLPPTFW